MEDGNCYSIQCFKKSACKAIPLRDTDVNPMFAYMDHFLDKVDEAEAAADITTGKLYLIWNTKKKKKKKKNSENDNTLTLLGLKPRTELIIAFFFVFLFFFSLYE